MRFDQEGMEVCTFIAAVGFEEQNQTCSSTALVDGDETSVLYSVGWTWKSLKCVLFVVNVAACSAIAIVTLMQLLVYFCQLAYCC